MQRRSWLSFVLLFGASAQATTADWQKINEKNGITVYKKAGEIEAFKGVGTVDAPIGKVLAVLLDNDHRTEWVDRLKKSEVIDRVSRYEYVVHQTVGLPWPYEPRDFVYRAKATHDKTASTVTLSMASEENPKAPATTGVRATLHHSSYVLTPKGPDKTEVQVEILSDPKGNLPKWVVNMVQKDWPQKTIEGLARQAMKPYVTDCPLPEA